MRITLAEARSFEPGTDRGYSQTGHLLTGVIIARATGGSHGRGGQRRVVEPLGQRETFVPGDAGRCRAMTRRSWGRVTTGPQPAARPARRSQRCGHRHCPVRARAGRAVVPGAARGDVGAPLDRRRGRGSHGLGVAGRSLPCDGRCGGTSVTSSVTRRPPAPCSTAGRSRPWWTSPRGIGRPQ
ncbi:serine hydrolase [Streptomyces buecherae]|uniref:Serine hydrolase n=1 Tax=Streptomyces buecherae TaxID=2763006 RepID=A0A7H8NGX3_9ACTN|nr:serine hydrolase [Streptomyces buecherae]